MPRSQREAQTGSQTFSPSPGSKADRSVHGMREVAGAKMRDVGLILGLGLAFSVGTAEAYEQQFDNSGWDRVLKKFVTEKGSGGLCSPRSEPGDFNQYVQQIAVHSPIFHPNDFPTRDSQLACWINVY